MRDAYGTTLGLANDEAGCEGMACGRGLLPSARCASSPHGGPLLSIERGLLIYWIGRNGGGGCLVGVAFEKLHVRF